jgi:endonuclease/exonuclease/phosphatase family metal-dependent hydrolase
MVVMGRLLQRCALLLALAHTACVATGPTPGAVRSVPAQLRIVTYNIFAGNDLERSSNLERVAALIDSVQADVVFLQEVDRRTRRSGDVDQLAVLADRTGMHGVYGRAMDYDGGEYGIALLSRWPLRASRVTPLDVAAAADTAATQRTEPRVLLHAVAETPSGAVHLLNTHLDHRGQSAARHTQLLQLLAYVADSVPRGAAIVLGGDLNASPVTTEVRALGVAFVDAWVQCGRGAGYTFRSDQPDRRIDYILLSGARCTAAQVLDRRLSDHFPVVVDVVVGGDPREGVRSR